MLSLLPIYSRADVRSIQAWCSGAAGRWLLESRALAFLLPPEAGTSGTLEPVVQSVRRCVEEGSMTKSFSPRLMLRLESSATDHGPIAAAAAVATTVHEAAAAQNGHNVRPLFKMVDASIIFPDIGRVQG